MVSLNRTPTTQPRRQPLSFTDDLPAEIRLEVYGHLFHIPNKFFELRVGVYRPAAVNSYPLLAAQMGRLRMMRVCKQIRGEVAEYFYGGSNFRFSHESGIAVMSCFFHTIGSFNCSFLRHVTVQLPNRPPYPGLTGRQSNAAWHELRRELSRQGMRNPNYKYQPRYEAEGRPFGAHCYDEAVHRVFRRLRNIPNLRRLEITIPAYHPFLDFDTEYDTFLCACPGVDIEAMSHDDRTRHIIRDHSRDSEYWDLLADLKENAASEDLTIALVLQYEAIEYVGPTVHLLERIVGQREGPWIAAYAGLMGYELGHARWETEGQAAYETYKVRHDADPLLRGSPRVVGNSLREVTELPDPVPNVRGDAPRPEEALDLGDNVSQHAAACSKEGSREDWETRGRV